MPIMPNKICIISSALLLVTHLFQNDGIEMKLGKPHNCKCLGMKVSVPSSNSLNICQQEHSMASPQHFTVLSTFPVLLVPHFSLPI